MFYSSLTDRKVAVDWAIAKDKYQATQSALAAGNLFCHFHCIFLFYFILCGFGCKKKKKKCIYRLDFRCEVYLDILQERSKKRM